MDASTSAQPVPAIVLRAMNRISIPGLISFSIFRKLSFISRRARFRVTAPPTFLLAKNAFL